MNTQFSRLLLTVLCLEEKMSFLFFDWFIIIIFRYTTVLIALKNHFSFIKQFFVSSKYLVILFFKRFF
jgi:hypothetical protein